LAAAIRELHEELGIRASKAERLPHCDYETSFSRHIVCVVESGDSPRLAHPITHIS
jgi:8-oxo-dGTP pyrophosphatase MutT (NUDIX family)